MVNKLKFNNLVISNKKGIQQSRIQTINKLVHKIRKLKSLIEKHPDNAKCKERIRKSTETMEILKKLKRMDVMKKVLLMDKSACAVISNGTCTPEEIAVALVSMNKVMQSLVKRFRTELQLNDVNGEWKQVLMQTSKRKMKIERTEEKRRNRLELKQQKTMGRKRQEWLEENQKHIENEIDMNVSTAGDWQIEQLLNDNCYRETIDEKESSSNKDSECYKKVKQDTRDTYLSNQSRQEPVNITKELTNVVKKQAKNVCNASSEKKDNASETLVVDPFFITDNGENYLSTAVIKREEVNKEESKELHMIKHNKKLKRSAQFKERNNHANYQKFSTEKMNQSSSIRREQNKCKRENVEIRHGSYNKKLSNSVDNNLHPSWLAKQKLKPLISDFQGKKIKFQYDDFNENDRQQIKEIRPNRAINAKPTPLHRDALHPSWAAKQKLKPSIIAFQGKKITFDNDE